MTEHTDRRRIQAADMPQTRQSVCSARPIAKLSGMLHHDFARAELYLRAQLSYSPHIDAVCVLGVFDGVHRGHQDLIAAAARDAHQRELPCIVVSFYPDPADVIGTPQPNSHLLRFDDRLELLARLGVDGILCFDFTPELLVTGWRDFLTHTLLSYLHPLSIHVGTNFRFGRGGQGGIAELKQLADEMGFELFAHELLQVDDEVVSATRIRTLLHEGRVESAAWLLGRQHFVRGVVEHGRGEGRLFGFPTANISLDPLDCVAGQGVYAGWVVYGRRAWPAAVNVGLPPSFSQSQATSFLEAHLIGFEGDVYGQQLAVSFTAWLRPSRSFASIRELETVVLNNIAWVKKHLGPSSINLESAGIYSLKAHTR